MRNLQAQRLEHATGFFRRCEAAISRLTGARPRHDDRLYEERYGVAAPTPVVRRG